LRVGAASSRRGRGRPLHERATRPARALRGRTPRPWLDTSKRRIVQAEPRSRSMLAEGELPWNKSP
jgi:hypothetical protein